MDTTLARRWWIFALRGVAAIAFGVLTFVYPGPSVIALVYLFGAYAIVDGVFNLGFVVRVARGVPRWGSLALAGVASIVAGLLAFVWPTITALVLVLILAAWAAVTGLSTIVAAVRLRKQIRGEWLMIISGVLSIGLAALLVLFPRAGALALVLWIGAYALVFGGLNLILAFRLRRTHAETPERTIPAGAIPVGR
jgi:uncharacterized membrane protein HdeD (DUF308 family)